MQPTCGELQVNPGPENNPDAGYRSRIDKSTEKAEVGKYSVFMTDTKITAEVSATDRASIQRYTFPAGCKNRRVLVDLYAPSEYPHNLQDAHITKVSDTEIEGYATYFGAYTGYTAEQYYTIHFVMQFDKSFASMGGWVNDQIKAEQKYLGPGIPPMNLKQAQNHAQHHRGVRKGRCGLLPRFSGGRGCKHGASAHRRFPGRCGGSTQQPPAGTGTSFRLGSGKGGRKRPLDLE